MRIHLPADLFDYIQPGAICIRNKQRKLLFNSHVKDGAALCIGGVVRIKIEKEL
jgi:hypothetical protein